MASKRKAGCKSLSVEAPIELVERLRALAVRNRRSMTGEAIVAIERYVQAEEALAAQAPAHRKSNKGDK
jgi:predicted transcriptional regulator